MTGISDAREVGRQSVLRLDRRRPGPLAAPGGNYNASTDSAQQHLRTVYEKYLPKPKKADGGKPHRN
jgi:hypothetical protein